MKKVIITLLCIFTCLSLFNVVAFADINIDELNDNDLLTLKAQVDFAVDTRGLSGKVIKMFPSGTYTVGVDISAGSYILTPLPDDKYVCVGYIYANQEAFEKHDNTTDFTVKSPGEKITLHDGEIIYLTWTSVMIQKYELLF